MSIPEKIKEATIQEYIVSQEPQKYKKYARVIALLFELNELGSFENFLYIDKQLKSRKIPSKMKNPDFVDAILSCYHSDDMKNKVFNHFKNILLTYKSYDTDELEIMLTKDPRNFDSIKKIINDEFIRKESLDLLGILSYCVKLDTKNRNNGLLSIPGVSSKSVSNFKDLLSDIGLDQNITNEEILLFEKILGRSN